MSVKKLWESVQVDWMCSVRINTQKISDNISLKQVKTKTASTTASVKSGTVMDTGESLPGRLLSMFNAKGIDVSRTTIHDIVSKLLALDIHPGNLDGDIALRSLILQQNDLPFTLELLFDNFNHDTSVFTKLSSLLESAYAVLNDSKVTGEIRTAIGMLIKNLDSLFRPETMQDSVRNALADQVSIWSRSFELKMIALMSNNPEAQNFMQASALDSLVPDGLARVLMELVRENPQVAGLMEKIGAITGDLISQLYGLPLETDAGAAGIKEAVAQLSARLTEIYPDIDMILQSTGNSPLADQVLPGFWGEYVQILQDRLLGTLEYTSLNNVLSGTISHDETHVTVHDMLRKSGMSFEWRLLAWYRSGKDPDRLRFLMQHDIKGILDKFLTELNIYRSKNSAKGTLENLERETKSTLDSITQRQISNILQDRGSGGKLYFELPFGTMYDKNNVRVTAEGGNNTAGDELNPDDLNITFDVETTGLGRLYVTLNVRKKNMSLNFLVKDEKIVAHAQSLRHELIDSLLSRGFTVSSLNIEVINDDTEIIKNTVNKRSVDITG